jgi:PEP-CTERM motif
MRRLFLLTAVSLQCLCAGKAVAGGTSVFNTSVPFNVAIMNDPAGNNSLTNSAPLNGGPTLIDGGLLSVSESITPTGTNSAIIQFTFTTTGNAPLAGNPSAPWQLEVSGFQTNGPGALQGPFYETFVDASGTSVPTLFPGYSLAPNPTDPSQTVAEIQASNTPRLVHSLTLSLGLFDQAPASYENGGIVPTTFVLGGEFVLTPVPEPASLTSFLVMGIVGIASMTWKRRQNLPA